MGNMFFSWGWVGLLGVGKAPPFCFFGGEWGCPLRGNTAPNYFFGGGRGWVRLASDEESIRRWVGLPSDGKSIPPFAFLGWMPGSSCPLMGKNIPPLIFLGWVGLLIDGKSTPFVFFEVGGVA